MKSASVSFGWPAIRFVIERLLIFDFSFVWKTQRLSIVLLTQSIIHGLRDIYAAGAPAAARGDASKNVRLKIVVYNLQITSEKRRKKKTPRVRLYHVLFSATFPLCTRRRERQADSFYRHRPCSHKRSLRDCSASDLRRLRREFNQSGNVQARKISRATYSSGFTRDFIVPVSFPAPPPLEVTTLHLPRGDRHRGIIKTESQHYVLPVGGILTG